MTDRTDPPTAASGSPRIGLVHAVAAAIAPIHAAFAAMWPQARLTNLFDDALPGDLERDGAITPAIERRILSLAQLAAERADGVLFTCSAFAPAIEAAAVRVPVPVLKPDEAMFDAALAAGARIGMLATFAPAVASTEAAFLRRAAQLGKKADIETVLVEHAWQAARAGDIARHDALVADAVERLQHCDAIMLAHFSTSTALERARSRSRVAVLSAPHAAVEALRARVPAKRG